MKISMTGHKKRWPFNTGDCLIEVTTWAGLIVLDCILIKTGIIKHRYQIQYARHVSGITYIRYAQNQKIGKPNNVHTGTCLGQCIFTIKANKQKGT